MKGKILNLKIVLTAMLALIVSLCFVVNFKEKEEFQKENSNVVAASTKTTIDNQEFSAHFNNNVIFSAEKVWINSDTSSDPISESDPTTTKFYYGDDSEFYLFESLPDENGKPKTVIDNGDFVRLDNKEVADDKFQSEENADRQEAIMVSFGAYVYDEVNGIKSAGSQADNSYTSHVRSLSVQLMKDGVAMPIEDPRQISYTLADGSTVSCFDFVFLLKQSDVNEGVYTFEFAYFYDFVTYSASFEFTVLNKLSYTQSLSPEKGYNAEPTLGWNQEGAIGFSKNELENGYVRYFIGQDGISDTKQSFPTLTYDYTKYALSFVHVANQKKTTHTLRTNIATKSAYEPIKLIWESTYNNQTTVREYPFEKSTLLPGCNLVRILLTEPGTYVFNYKFLYRGDSDVGQVLNFKTKEIKLSIHGLSAYYSKENFEGAKLQHLKIEEDVNFKYNIDLIAMNGYNSNEEDITQFKNQKIGFAYDLVEEDLGCEGDVILENSKDANIDAWARNKKSAGLTTTANNYDYLTGARTHLYSGSENNYMLVKDFYYYGTEYIGAANAANNSIELGGILADIPYVETNQGSIWIEKNDEYTSNSFYFEAKNRLEISDIFEIETPGVKATASKAKPFTNTTSFNSYSYYLLFLEVQPEGLDGDYKYWQVFAFRYTSLPLTITTQAVVDDKGTYDDISDDDVTVIANGGYTNKYVRISWQQPGIFDRKIEPYYYTAQQNLTEEEMMAGTEISLVGQSKPAIIDGVPSYYVELGSEVANGQFRKYLIKLKNEGDSATNKMFTVDRQQITGVKPYLIKEMYSSDAMYYTIATTNADEDIEIKNGITDSLATIYWDDKLSGAPITAEYSYTTFSSNFNTPSTMTGTEGDSWLLSNYQLGTTVTGNPLSKTRTSYEVPEDCVLVNQGLYIITITDAAGNFCNYAFIIDRTESYFAVKTSGSAEEYDMLQNTEKVFGEDVEVNIFDQKVFKVASSNAVVASFIEAAANKSLASLTNYYGFGDTNPHHTAMSDLFKKIGTDYYFTVRNIGFDVYKDIDFVNTQGTTSTLSYADKEDGEGYYYRTLYIKSANDTFSTKDITDNTFVRIEINKDNSRGYVYYANSKIENVPENGGTTSGLKKLTYGADYVEDPINSNEGFKKAEATSARNIAFVWNIGEGNYEVGKVELFYYQLDTSKDVDLNASQLYFYNFSASYTLFGGGENWENGASEIVGGRGLVSFDGDKATKEGLYVIKRTYKNDADFGDSDGKSRNYYFIVDRKGIIDSGVGQNIRICLMEDESCIDKDDFSLSNADRVESSIDGLDLNYEIFLRTTKLPATLNIPTGKYVDSNSASSADYDSGKLKLKVYFNDTYNLLDNTNYKGKAFVIYDSHKLGAGYEIVNGCFKVNIYEYVNNFVSKEVASILTNSSYDKKDWLFLSGDYIIEITDSVKDFEGNYHKQILGFQIVGYEDQGPQIKLYSGYEESSMSEIGVIANNNGNFVATANQQYVKLVIPVYVEEETEKAQVDPGYIVITDQDGNYFVNHPYSPQNDISLNRDGEYHNGAKVDLVEVDLDGDGSVDGNEIHIYLNTKEDDSSYESLFYTITVRYKIGKGSDYQKYKECYVRNNLITNKTYFYESVYSVIIDKEAPTTNVKNLAKEDKLHNDYAVEFGTPEGLLNKGKHGGVGTNRQFTYQYDKYYQDKQSKYIYPFNVIPETKFSLNDVAKVYVKQISDLSNHTLTALPFTGADGFEVQSLTGDVNNETTYGALIISGTSLTSGVYYEVIEEDAAGNITQYVIHYYPENTKIEIPTTIKKPNSEEHCDITFEGFNIGVNVENSINILDIVGLAGVTLENDHYVKVELKKLRVGPTFKLLTTSQTDLDYYLTANNDDSMISKLKVAGPGNYYLNIDSRDMSVSLQIDLIDIDSIEVFEADVIVLKDEEDVNNWKINLYKAIALKNDLTSYATEIEIKEIQIGGTTIVTKYKGSIIEENSVQYHQYNEVSGLYDILINSPISCTSSSTYVISLKNLDDTVKKYRFNPARNEYNDIIFANSVEYKVGDIFYTFDDVTVKYDKNIYTCIVSKNISGSWYEATVTPRSDVTFNYVDIEADEDGSYKHYKMELFVIGETNYEIKYEFVIDTRLSDVALRDAATGENTEDSFGILNNRDIVYAMNNTTPKEQIGIMNLKWSEIEENAYFNYEFRLYEKLDDGSLRIGDDGRVGLDLNGVTNYTIATKDDSAGVYCFEIKVLSKDDVYLGNKTFVFKVQNSSTQLYYVNNYVGEANSYFMYNELGSLQSQISTKFAEFATNINLQKMKLPLYVSNQNISVTAVGKRVQTETKSIQDGFSIARIYNVSGTFNIYVGLLIIEQRTELIQDAQLKIDDGTEHKIQRDDKDTLSFSIINNPSQEVFVKGKITTQSKALTSKNITFIDVYYNNKFVASEQIETPFSYKVLGNGDYSFRFRDLAGNIHEFKKDSDGDNSETEDWLNVLVVREVVVRINDNAPIENGFYNEAVKMAIYRSDIYSTGTISIQAWLNGSPYVPAGQNPYEFNSYGNYRVVIKAQYSTNGSEPYNLSKTLLFTIVNVKEARKSIDLTTLSGKEITKVTNSTGKVITTEFVKMMNDAMSRGGVNISYDDVMANALKLGVTTGKTTFNISYKHQDYIYPVRDLNFSFTLNNENPSIECTLKSGEKSTKGFEIFFNPTIIYEQIGEAYVYINDVMVCHINEGSANEELRFNTTYKQSGDGDYYVKLVSSSGVVLQSYKVTIKEPLNFWAIVVIVVVVAIVGTVTITIIVLRRRMRIR